MSKLIEISSTSEIKSFNGTIETGRPLDETGAHTLGANQNIGICLIGKSNQFTSQQIESCHNLIKALKIKEDISIVKQHSDYDAVNMRQYRKLEDRVDEAHAGIASVAAIAAIPAPVSGKNMSLGVGFGNFESEAAVAVGGWVWGPDQASTMHLIAGVGFLVAVFQLSGIVAIFAVQRRGDQPVRAP